MSTVTAGYNVRIIALREEAEGVRSLELASLSGEALPPFKAGAHIDIHIAIGLTRSYSLVNPEGERHRYIIAVNRDEASRGGSAFVHNNLKMGSELSISAPRNNFALVENASHAVFIAGGIGITPLWCMIQRLEALGRPWTLYYSARTRKHAAFLSPLQELAKKYPDGVHFNFDQEPGGKILDLTSIVECQADDAHLYCCGPTSMLAAFEQACGGRPPANVHVEYFSGSVDASMLGGFTVVLARAGKELTIPHGKSILSVLLESDIDAPYSCTEGVCGTCKVDVIEGVPDHRDHVLTEAEQEQNRAIMICCSGSKSARLVLDL